MPVFCVQGTEGTAKKNPTPSVCVRGEVIQPEALAQGHTKSLFRGLTQANLSAPNWRAKIGTKTKLGPVPALKGAKQECRDHWALLPHRVTPHSPPLAHLLSGVSSP